MTRVGGHEFTVSGIGHLALDLAQHNLHSLCISSLYIEVLLTQQGSPLQSVSSWLGLWFKHTDNCLYGKKLKQVLHFSFEHLSAWEQSSVLPQNSPFQKLEADFFQDELQSENELVKNLCARMMPFRLKLILHAIIHAPQIELEGKEILLVFRKQTV